MLGIEMVTFRNGYFCHERGNDWVGVAYVSDSISKTVFIRRDTDSGLRDCNSMLSLIKNMSNNERQELIER